MAGSDGPAACRDAVSSQNFAAISVGVNPLHGYPHRMITLSELESGLETVQDSPRDQGSLEMIAVRPAEGERRILDQAVVDLELGIDGDMWSRRPSRSGPDGGPNPKAQVTVMNSRVIELVAGGRDHDLWALAGDQLYVDFDLSEDNLPVGSRLQIADSLLEVTADPHLGCGKFARRFGSDALKFVNSATGRRLRLRGINCRVIAPGPIAPGNGVAKVDRTATPDDMA